jgi:hypothetical protein
LNTDSLKNRGDYLYTKVGLDAEGKLRGENR